LSFLLCPKPPSKSEVLAVCENTTNQVADILQRKLSYSAPCLIHHTLSAI
jgi:hypothetical protein